MVEPDNVILVSLREMRAEIAGVRDDIHATEARLAELLERLDRRIDALHANGLKAMKGFVGHGAMAERSAASFEDQMSRLELRVLALENAGA